MTLPCMQMTKIFNVVIYTHTYSVVRELVENENEHRAM